MHEEAVEDVGLRMMFRDVDGEKVMVMMMMMMMMMRMRMRREEEE